MANLSFDFNKVKRSFMTVTLKDNRKLIVKMPMKKTFEKLSALQEMDTDSMTAEDAMDTHRRPLRRNSFPQYDRGAGDSERDHGRLRHRGNGSVDRRLHGVRRAA